MDVLERIDQQVKPTAIHQIGLSEVAMIHDQMVETMKKTSTSTDPYAAVGGERTYASYSWSNFSHNAAGMFLLAMSLGALGANFGWRWARNWPVGAIRRSRSPRWPRTRSAVPASSASTAPHATAAPGRASSPAAAMHSRRCGAGTPTTPAPECTAYRRRRHSSRRTCRWGRAGR